MGAPAVRFLGIGKKFPGVRALSDVSFDVRPGECHAILGENGAGKSTLGKILGGLYEADGGTVELFGQPVRFRSPLEARRAGVAIVHQEILFCENLSIGENLCLHELPHRMGRVRFSEVAARARALLRDVGFDVDPRHPMAGLSIGRQQLVQIAAGVGSGAQVIVFDEPTSSLSLSETRHLFDLIRRLKAEGVTCLYVSHRLEEIRELCDRATVLRDGRYIATFDVVGTATSDWVRAMVGREVEVVRRSPGRPPGSVALEVIGLSSESFREVTFTVREGEILGFAGLVGAGRSEIMESIFGLRPITSGKVKMYGKPVHLRNPRWAINAGLGLAPEDRKRSGLVPMMSVRSNATLPILERFSRAGFVRQTDEKQLAGQWAADLKVKTPSMETPVVALSGGNQQKVVVSRWTGANCRVLIFDEPTRGVDIAAKDEIHALIRRLADEGAAVLLVSSDMPELLALSDRIHVVREGRLVAEERAGTTSDELMRLMAGLNP